MTHRPNAIERLNGIKNWQAVIIILIIGMSVFFSGISGGFQGDDQYQITDNKLVHSINTIPQQFGGGTFWNGENLVGSFYRPIMSTVFSVIYAFSGANPILFHIIQILLIMACSFVLYLFFKNFFRPITSLIISLLCLIHPINSQAAFAIPSMQEPLFFLFGILALYVLAKGRSTKTYVITSIFLLLSLLSKETGIVFVAIALLYTLLHKKNDFKYLLKFLIPVIVLYGMMRIGAIGIHPPPIQAAPISHLDFFGRMVTLPSVLVFYMLKIIFPLSLSTGYYWIYTSPSFDTFVLPLVTLTVLGAILFIFGRKIYKRKLAVRFKLFLFFLGWVILGSLPHMQFVALDATAVEVWVFSALPGIFGLMAVVAGTYITGSKIKYVLFGGIILVITAFGVRTAVRGFDYKSQATLAYSDTQNSVDNYLAINNYAQALIQANKFKEAESYARNSIMIYPTLTNYANLGVAQQKQGNFEAAKMSYEKALTFGNLASTYENLAIVSLISDPPDVTVRLINDGLQYFPHNFRLYTYLSFAKAEMSDQKGATAAITRAAQLGDVSQTLYFVVTSGHSIDIPMPYTQKTIHLY